MIDDRAFHSGAGCDVRELERDESSADEQDPSGQRFEVEEVGTVDHVLMAAERERARPGAGGNQEPLRHVLSTVDLKLMGARESCCAVKECHAVSHEFVFHTLGYGIGEATLVAHQSRPVQRQLVLADPLVLHQASIINHFRASSENLLWITPA
jgi:hypothetical protein